MRLWSSLMGEIRWMFVISFYILNLDTSGSFFWVNIVKDSWEQVGPVSYIVVLNNFQLPSFINEQ